MPSYTLNSTTGDQSIEIPSDRSIIVGRAVTSDLPVYDPTVSRKHAEIKGTPTGAAVTDLGSSNGTFVNGTRVTDSPISSGDVVTFGKVAFNLQEVAAAVRPAESVRAPAPARESGGTIVRQLPVKEATSLEAQVKLAVSDTKLQKQDSADAREATKLSLLLEISKELGKQQDVEKLLEKVVDITFKVMDVDRVSILMVDEAGELVPRVSRNKLGEGSSTRHVPRSIASRCVEERLAILTDNAAEDQRFKGQSILMQSVRSAMTAPLMGSEGKVLGILYVDNMTATNSFGDEDLEFLIAFSGIAAVSIENSELTKQVAREAVKLSNFQRYFAPNLIDQISNQEAAVELGGSKRPVVIFFSDIRGFTSMSAEMGPDEIAKLLTEYFTEMVDIVFEYGGTLDKFMGDAIMALWGAPIAQDGDADRAMTAALEMLDALDKLNEKWAAENQPHVEIGIGINYGEVFAGNIGSEKRLEYTVIGDSVNVASRLCSHAPGGDILVSEPFYQMLRNPPAAVKTDLKVKGKKEEVPAYRVKR